MACAGRKIGRLAMQKDRGGAILLGPNLVLTGLRRAVSSVSVTLRAQQKFRERIAPLRCPKGIPLMAIPYATTDGNEF
jgi:hypothetical protein